MIKHLTEKNITPIKNETLSLIQTSEMASKYD